MKPLRVTLIQHSAGSDPDRNLLKIEALLDSTRPADLIVLPESFALRGDARRLRRAAGPLDAGLLRWLRRLALRHGAWVLGGSVVETRGRDRFNTAVLVNRSGRLVARYRKLHLFQARLGAGRPIRESDLYTPGRRPVMATIDGWRVGLAVCYDLRFPELFRHYSARGADLFLVPSDFTRHTGRDHWETLVRARAIENQCFIAAPNQTGANPDTGVRSYGHSLVADPWGRPLIHARTAESALQTVLDPACLANVRGRMPARRHPVLQPRRSR